ncbi:MAG: deoxyribodipyrimidine photolyase [Aphanocapsa feldmannii 277cV]|uniref:Deoxyribodipyrimidine photolyase n=1 Tax=Aphanocapsa feldmannii 277cV TaxID=2507553 RepID=A0A524RN99_9CHRO|nr:MAG: deoxyribodipyrimidine photolyase [Aphanocapsa feldmannii 288cV]TGG92269.1 MAG: deoxyribodipyrimidine photolyase [Aphanocapsa feldmannii 277cV]
MDEAHWLFWHRRDLRLSDNVGLAELIRHSRAVTGVFLLEPHWWRGELAAPSRLWFLLESLRELQQAWRRIGSRLLVLQGEALTLLPALAARTQARGVAWNEDVEPWARLRDAAVARRLAADGVRVQRQWDQLLVEPASLTTGSGGPYRVYGPYRRAWFARPKPAPRPAPGGLVDHLRGQDLGLSSVLEQLPTAAGMGLPWQGDCPCQPGEAAALEQLEAFVHRPITSYDTDRNIPSLDGTSRLSAALRFGTLGPRSAWAASLQAEAGCGSEEALRAINVWQQELAWREFYQQALFHLPELADGPYRPQWRRFPWDNDGALFQAWCEGRTGYPIVDAAMRQLNATGWMHNRCRMIVASFLTKDLFCDWRLGERYFMATLVDGDLAANNGGWQWSTSSGMDPRPLRIFNPTTQARQFDPEGVYIRRWLPELASCDAGELLGSAVSTAAKRGYPAPIVDHRSRQAEFKARYASIRP